MEKNEQNTNKAPNSDDKLVALQAENEALKKEIEELKDILAAVEKSSTVHKELLEANGLVIVTDSKGNEYKVEKERKFWHQSKEMKCEDLVDKPTVVDFLVQRGVNFLYIVQREGE